MPMILRTLGHRATPAMKLTEPTRITNHAVPINEDISASISCFLFP